MYEIGHKRMFYHAYKTIKPFPAGSGALPLTPPEKLTTVLRPISSLGRRYSLNIADLKIFCMCFYVLVIWVLPERDYTLPVSYTHLTLPTNREV